MSTATQVFAFHAIGADGSNQRGTVEADDIASARLIVAARGCFVLSVEAKGLARTRRAPISSADLALGLRMLADLLESGLSVARALHALEELAPGGWRPALPHIRQSIREGKSLAAAFTSAPVEIPPLVIGIAQAGEAGSGIGPAIRRAAQLTESRAELRAATLSALAYPFVVACAGISAVSVLILVVLPRFAKILADLGQTLPASTRVVLRVSAIARSGITPAAVVALLIFVAWRAWVRTERGHQQWHRLLLMLPGIGSIRNGSASARVATALAALLESGVPISTSMGHAARAAGDAEIEARLLEARALISSGQTLSRALETTGAVSATSLRLIRAGEESGRVAAMLEHAARLEQQRVDRLLRASIRMLEPVLLLAFASVVALVAAALLQAIYSVRPTV
jgi:type II secretory pathway component PulF